MDGPPTTRCSTGDGWQRSVELAVYSRICPPSGPGFLPRNFNLSMFFCVFWKLFENLNAKRCNENDFRRREKDGSILVLESSGKQNALPNSGIAGYVFNLSTLSKFQESFELEMTFICICCTVWLPRKWEKVEKKRKYFFIWIFNIIADVDVLMLNFFYPKNGD